MSRYVLDASFAIAVAMGEDRSPVFTALAATSYAEGYVVPSHWRLEVANGILGNLSRARKDIGAAGGYLAELGEMPVVTDWRTEGSAWSRTLVLAQRHHQSTLDMAYVELALREGGILLTLDKGMKRAAVSEGADVLP